MSSKISKNVKARKHTKKSKKNKKNKGAHLRFMSSKTTLKLLMKQYNIKIRKRDYKNYKKKLTGYILFTIEAYKRGREECISLNSKKVAKIWGELRADERDIYNILAKKFKKKNKRKKKVVDVKSLHKQQIIDVKSYNHTNKVHMQLRTEVIDGVTYILDCFDNIISRTDGDIGFINGEGKVVMERDDKETKAEAKAKAKKEKELKKAEAKKMRMEARRIKAEANAKAKAEAKTKEKQ